MPTLENHSANLVIRILSVVLIVLSAAVSIPLAIKTYLDNGGAWGFGIIGLPILIPLSFYFLFGIAGVLRTSVLQRRVFIISHLVTFSAGLTILIVFPLYPAWLVSVPLTLAVVGILSRNRYKIFLALMIALGVAANSFLLKWELDFHRSLPIVQLFQAEELNP